jgi:hypothetical protein
VRRTCFVHIGTHKTATSSLQAFLTLNEAALLSAGVLVPQTGRPEHLFGHRNIGHHNIAWELNGDPRFEPEAGTLRDLASEISEVDPDRVVLSSEDFEYLHAKPAALDRLSNAIGELGYALEIVAYVRPQHEYVETLYLELIKHGLGLHFSEFLDAILEQGAFSFREGWVFEFDYVKLLDAFVSVAGDAHVSVRRYRQEGPSTQILSEFASIIRNAGGEIAFEGLTLPKRINQRMSLEDAYNLLTGDAAGGMPVPIELWKDGDTGRLIERFGPVNETLDKRYGLYVPVCASA